VGEDNAEDYQQKLEVLNEALVRNGDIEREIEPVMYLSMAGGIPEGIAVNIVVFI